jgi:hypothetical protein
MILVRHGGGEGGHYFMDEACMGVASDATDHTPVPI